MTCRNHRPLPSHCFALFVIYSFPAHRSAGGIFTFYSYILIAIKQCSIKQNRSNSIYPDNVKILFAISHYYQLKRQHTRTISSTTLHVPRNHMVRTDRLINKYLLLSDCLSVSPCNAFIIMHRRIHRFQTHCICYSTFSRMNCSLSAAFASLEKCAAGSLAGCEFWITFKMRLRKGKRV